LTKSSSKGVQVLLKGISRGIRTRITTKKSVGLRNQAQTRNTTRILQGISNKRKRKGSPIGLSLEEPQDRKDQTIGIRGWIPHLLCQEKEWRKETIRGLSTT